MIPTYGSQSGAAPSTKLIDMNIWDIQLKLDRRCIVAIKQQGGVFNLLSRVEERIPIHDFTMNGERYFQLYFIKKNKPSSPVLSLVTRDDAVEKKGFNR